MRPWSVAGQCRGTSRTCDGAAAAAALALRPLKSESNFFTTMVETLTGEETSLSDTAGDVSKQKGTEKTNASMFLLLS